MYSSGEMFMRSRDGYFVVYFPSCSSTREINIKMSLQWVHKQFARNNESIYDVKNDELHAPPPCRTRSVYVPLMTSQSTVDDVTMTRQLWREHVKRDI